MRKKQGKHHILIVDDEEIIRELVADILFEAGYFVTSRDSGTAALGFFSENREDIDLVILDIVMPDMNGADVFSELRKLNPMLKVIFLSGYPKDEEIDELLSSEDVDYLQKPISIKTLLEKIKTRLSL